MLNTKGIDTHSEELPLFSFLEISPAGPQFFAHAIVTVYAFVNFGCGIYWQLDSLAQRTHRAYVIRMIVRDEHTHYILEIKPHVAQTFLYLSRRNSRINQDALLTRAQVIAIAATAAGKTPKYEPILLHVNKKSCKDTKKK